jgi:thiosulfate/3-mercaptopyruvate sulfurtransferase
LRAWLADGGSLDIGDHAPIAMSPPPLTPQPGFFADIDEVRAALRSDGVALVNVLRREVFSGAENPYGRPGHIPGSINLPYAELVDPDTSKVDLERVRDAARALPPGPAVTYCGSGITAAGYALALRAAGRHDVRVYDGSLSEWAADPTNPLHADHLTNESETSP